MKKCFLALILFSISLYSMGKEEPSDGLHFQLQQMINNIEKSAQENERLEQEIHWLEQRKKKSICCRNSKSFLVSIYKKMCVALCLICAFDQLFTQP